MEKIEIRKLVSDGRLRLLQIAIVSVRPDAVISYIARCGNILADTIPVPDSIRAYPQAGSVRTAFLVRFGVIHIYHGELHGYGKNAIGAVSGFIEQVDKGIPKHN